MMPPQVPAVWRRITERELRGPCALDKDSAGYGLYRTVTVTGEAGSSMTVASDGS